MLHFTVASKADALDTLQTLPEVFAIENAEMTLFRPEADIFSEAGFWSPILRCLTAASVVEGRGHLSGIHWIKESRPVRLKRGVIRFARWAEVKLGNEILIAAFLPHVYSENGKEFVDHRFVVGCSNEQIVPLILLIADQIGGNTEGDDSWEMASPSSTNMDSMHA